MIFGHGVQNGLGLSHFGDQHEISVADSVPQCAHPDCDRDAEFRVAERWRQGQNDDTIENGTPYCRKHALGPEAEDTDTDSVYAHYEHPLGSGFVGISIVML